MCYLLAHKLVEPTAEYLHLGQILDRAERHLALLQRATPLNFSTECTRLVGAWDQGHAGFPRWQYRRERLDPEAARALRAVKQEALTLGALGELFAERSDELLQEAELVAAVGTASFAARARVRMKFGAEPLAADELALRWASAPVTVQTEKIAVDDVMQPAALINVMRRELERLSLPLKVQVQRGLAATAAVTWDGVLIAEGQSTTELDARRIAVHEIYGHAVPLWNATQATQSALGAVLRAGSAWGTETQEGWAVWLENRFGLLHAGRRRALGLRHLAAVRTRMGGDFVEVVRSFTDTGVSAEEIVPIVARAQRGADGRGGGLARESVYLCEALQVEQHGTRAGQLAWFTSGRVSLAAIERLSEWGYTPPATGVTFDGVVGAESRLRQGATSALTLREL